MAPAGTPQPIVEKLNREITKIVSRPDIKAAWEKQGAEPVTMTQPQFKAFMDAQIAKWAGVIKANHIPAINYQRRICSSGRCATCLNVAWRRGARLSKL